MAKVMQIPVSSSGRSASPERITAVLSAELRNHMFIFALIMVVLRIMGALSLRDEELFGDSFVFAVILFSAFFCILEHLFKLFVKGLAPRLFSVLPAFIIYFLVKDMENFSYLGMAVIIAAFIRVVTGFLPFWEKIVLYGSIVLFAVAIYLSFELHVFSGEIRSESLTFVCLVTLVLSAVQQIFTERGKGAFPFSYFAIIGLLIFFLPVKDEPIDWTPVIEAGERLAQGADDWVNSVSYYFGDVFKGGDYTTGYSSLSSVGGRTIGSQKTELILHTDEKPYVYFEDSESGEYMKRRRSVYLVGGRGLDKENLISIFNMLYRAQVDREYARLFMKQSRLDVEYMYLRTRDEIAPLNSFNMAVLGKNIENGTAKTAHKKGYEIKTRYLDIDYGSPYYSAVVKEAEAAGNVQAADYDELCNFIRKNLSIDIENFVSRDEYAEITNKNMGFSENGDGELDVTGASERMKALSMELTAGFSSDYDKCRAIEEYIRQYTYSLDASSGENHDVDMTTAQGMSELADSFLFETGKGYCIHYTSAMVMLLRLSGIPARPALGFCYLYPFDEEEEYKVSGNRAHTWPEAYIENVGWVPFEPTSTYPTAQNMTWNKTAPPEIVKETQGAAASTYAWQQYAGGYVQGNVPELPDTIEENEEKNDTSLRIAYIGIVVALCVAILFIVLLLGTAIFGRLRYSHGTNEQKLRLDVEQIKKQIRKHSGEDFFDRGLLSDYIERAPGELRAELSEVFDAYYRLEYSTNVAGSVDAADIEKARKLREYYTKKRAGKKLR